MFAQAASLSPTTALATCAAASAGGNVVSTRRASVIARSALPQPADGVRDGGRTLETFRRQPAEDLAPARHHHADPTAHGQLDQPAVQLHPDLPLRVLRDYVLEEQDPALADVGVGLRRNARDRAGRHGQLEVRVLCFAVEK